MEENDEFEEIERLFLQASNNNKFEKTSSNLEKIIQDAKVVENKTFSKNDIVRIPINIISHLYHNTFNDVGMYPPNFVSNFFKNQERIGIVLEDSGRVKTIVNVVGIFSNLKDSNGIYIPNHILSFELYTKDLEKATEEEFLKFKSDFDKVSSTEIDNYTSELWISKVNKKNIIYNRAIELEIARLKELEKVNQKINEIKNLAEEIHGENADFAEINAAKEFTPNTSYKYRLTIKFPEFTIKNSRNKSHKVVDFYISMFFDVNFRMFSTLYGKRGAVTLEEYESRYGHSHLNTSNSFQWSNLCLGSGTELSYVTATLGSDGYNVKNLTKLLLLLHSYVSWESLEGTPYVNLESVSRKTNNVLTTYSDNEKRILYKKFIKTLMQTSLELPVKLSQVNNFNTFIIDEKNLEKLLTSSLDKVISNSYFVLKASDGTYVAIQNGSIVNYKERIRNAEAQMSSNSGGLKCKICFKGEFLETKIIDSIDSDNLETVLNPNITKYILDILTKNINNYYLTNKKYELSSM